MKTANFSTACGRVTLKSPPSRGSDAPHVHSRLRKHLSRCTLDCGFKTPESPALRGFVAERCPIRGTSLYLVLKSNGLRHSKNLPVKFGFSPRTVPANIAKKLPAQRCSKPHFIAFFSLSHKRPTFAFTGESGLHTRLSEKDRTQRLARRNRGIPFCEHSVALRCQRNPFYSTVLLYTYISQFSVNPHHRQKRKSRRRCHRNSVPNRFSSRFLTSPTNGPRSLSQTKMGTHSAFRERSHTRAHTAKQGAFRMGVVSLPSDCFTRFGNPAWPGGRTANFAAFGAWPWVLPKNAESLRDSDALMRVAVPRRRGPAGLRDPVAIVSMIKNMINPWAGSFLIFCWANANSIKKVVLQPF